VIEELGESQPCYILSLRFQLDGKCKRDQTVKKPQWVGKPKELEIEKF
jgi:hypothetical protein